MYTVIQENWGSCVGVGGAGAGVIAVAIAGAERNNHVAHNLKCFSTEEVK